MDGGVGHGVERQFRVPKRTAFTLGAAPHKKWLIKVEKKLIRINSLNLASEMLLK